MRLHVQVWNSVMFHNTDLMIARVVWLGFVALSALIAPTHVC